ncbi:protein kinase domain-containing protein [Sorangium sp. So ce131]|uniref:serine/threonine-protein kinase n=1 Tax=Sorangium sp. So ce131 TaxID=3133282 RepID=UPI003F5FD0D3
MRQEALLGRKVAGRFTITRFLGEGGMASVFVAERDAEPRRVAIKIMNPEFTADRAFVRRFQREAKAAARVKHPNSVKIYEYGVEGALSYIVMELLAGDDLYVLLERHGAVGQARAARILAEVCDALAVAHEMGVVHRDLKPENIMVIADPSHPHGERVKVLDFGIAKILDTVSSSDEAELHLDPMSVVTRAGTFIGTPAYMSPEQCGLLPIDPRADLYTCGVLLFQLVTGRLPFEGETPLHTATLHIHAPVPAPSGSAPGIDRRLEALIVKALAKLPVDRHQTARELGDALRSLLVDLPDTAVGLGPISRRQPSSLLPREVLPARAPDSTLPPEPSAPQPTAAVLAALEAMADVSIESARTLVSGSSGPDPRPPPPVLLRSPPAELPLTLDAPGADSTVGFPPQRWAGESVPEISLQLPSWSQSESEALLSGNGLAGSSSFDDPSDEDSTLTMVRREELMAPAKVRVQTASYDEGDELDITPPGRDVKATLRSAEDFGLGTPEKRAEIGLVRIDSAPAAPPVTPQSPQFDAGAAAAWDRRSRRVAATLRIASPYDPIDSQQPTAQPGELQASGPGWPGAVSGGPGATSAELAGSAPGADQASSAAGSAAPVPLELASTVMSRSPIGDRRSGAPGERRSAAPVAPHASQRPPATAPEASWLAGKRGLIIGFVAGMILTAAAMVLLMRLL